MQPVEDGFSVVLAGAWNAAIFSPAWVSGHLTEAEEIGLELSVNNLALGPRLAFDELFLRVMPDRLVISPKEIRDDLLQKCQEVSIKILTDLSHTPIRAVGVNFKFIEPEPAGALLETFTLTDTNNLTDAGAVVRTTSIRRGLEIAEQQLNLTLEFGANDQIGVDLNFHRDVENAQAAADHLKLGILEFRDQAIQLIQSAYTIEEIGV